MKMSFRAKRQAKQNARLAQASKLNLVALMDIFTILVFFLMVNQSEVTLLQSDSQMALPSSSSQQMPAQTAALSVHVDKVSLQGQIIWQGQLSDPTAMAQLGVVLTEQLSALAKSQGELPVDQQATGRAITVLGDKQVPYALLKQVLSICAATEFRNVSLAVELKPEQAPAPAAGSAGTTGGQL